MLSDLDLMPSWVAEDLACPPWESEVDVPEVPAWLLDSPVRDEEPQCDCGCSCLTSEPDADVAATTSAAVEATSSPVPAQLVPLVEEPVRWAVPGVWDDEPGPSARSVGAAVGAVQQAVAGLRDVVPSHLAPGQALGEAEALLEVERDLRVLRLARLNDVCERRLFADAGFRNTRAWLGTVAPDVALQDTTLAGRLPDLPHVYDALRAGRVSVTGADHVAAAVRKVARHLDAPDGLLDGRPAEPVIEAVVGNVVDLVCRDRFGVEHDPTVDPERAALLVELEAQTAAIAAGGGSQRDRVEQAMVLLARYLHPSRLAGPLDELVLSLVPSVLEKREKTAQDKRRLKLTPHDDGTWDLRGTLTPEAGERLHTALAAEARRDPANPVDTAARAEQRAAAAEADGGDGWSDAAEAPEWELRARREDPEHSAPDADELVPRSPSKRLHDAFDRLLDRYLSQGLGGVRGKVPVQVSVTASERTVVDAPGAPPARGASGQPIARSLLRRWWCDSHVTVLLMSRGWKPLGVVHSGRTITATESKAAAVQFDNRCPGIGCCPGTPNPLIPLVPHHLRKHAKYGKTSLEETLLICERLHDDIHLGKRTIRLRDGRLITEDGWLLDDS